jgi:GNAT superfamily N-acetyltransferase
MATSVEKVDTPRQQSHGDPMTGPVPGEVLLREARIDELQMLGELCLRSKAVWGYDADFVEACRRELSLAKEDLGRTAVRVAEREGRPIGLAQVAVEGEIADLVKLFIEPDELGRGWGRLLFQWAVLTAREAGASRMTIDSDPGAVPFYVRMGARQVGLVPSGSIPGRSLPRLEVALCPICDISPAEAGFQMEQEDEDV